MSLNPQALTTVARLKAFMKKTDSSDDALLETLINVCTDQVENYCERRFLKTAYSQEVYDGSGHKVLLLNNYPVDTSATFLLEQRDSLDNENNWSTVPSSDYHLDDQAGRITLMSGANSFIPISGRDASAMGRFNRVPRQYRVTYTAGYAFKNDAATFVTLESIGCGDLELAVWLLVKRAFRRLDGDVQSESIGDYSVSFRLDAGMLDPVTKDLLQKYVRQDAVL